MGRAGVDLSPANGSSRTPIGINPTKAGVSDLFVYIATPGVAMQSIPIGQQLKKIDVISH